MDHPRHRFGPLGLVSTLGLKLGGGGGGGGGGGTRTSLWAKFLDEAFSAGPMEGANPFQGPFPRPVLWAYGLLLFLGTISYPPALCRSELG